MNYSAIKSKFLAFYDFYIANVDAWCCAAVGNHKSSGIEHSQIVNNDYDTYSNIYFPIPNFWFGNFYDFWFRTSINKRVLCKCVLLAIVVVCLEVLFWYVINPSYWVHD